MPTVTNNLFRLVSDAIRLRALGAGASTFADQTWVYDSGTITSATDNGDGTVTIGDSTKTWTFAGGTLKRWTQATPGSNGIAAWDWGSYDLVIEAPSPDYTPDPRKVLQAAITAQPDATHVTVPLAPATRITEGRLSAVSDLVGRRYWILRAGGQNWTRGYFQQPNDPAVRYGRIVGVDVSSGTSTTLTSDRDLTGGVAGTVAVGLEILYRDSGDVMRRKTITAVDTAARTITWAGTSNPPVVEPGPVKRDFYVVAVGAVWVWDAQGGTANTAYSGLRGAGYWGHGTDDDPGTAFLPTLTYPVLYGTDPLSCPIDPTDTPIFARPEDGRDLDLLMPHDNECGDKDLFVNPWVHRSLRGWWSALMGICTGYINPVSYDGLAAVAIPNLTIATWFYHAGVNPFTATCGTHSGTSMPCALGVPHTPISLWWTIKGADGSDLLSGYTDSYDGSTINGAFTSAHDGKTVLASTGPTRPVPKRVGRMHDVVYFIPSLDGDPEAAQTPSNTFPGTWTIRAKSTHCRIADATHAVVDSALSRHAITDGGYYRLVGDNLDDPGLAATLSTAVDQPLADYHNNAYVGTRARATQAAIDASRSGTATGGSTVRIVDTSKDWLSVDFYPGSNGLTHTGTFTAGSTTGGTDSTKAGTATWASSRFPGFASSLAGFTVEVLMSGSSFSDPSAVVEKRLIATGNGTTGALTWAEALSASANGKTYRIREPAVLNRWRSNNVPLVTDAEDNWVTVTHPDGTTATVAILGNHDDTLFVDDLPFAVVAGCSYAIHVPQMSAVYLRDSGQWYTTADAGADARFTDAVFRPQAQNNAEDTFTEFGLYRPNDQPFTEACFAELVAAVNILKWTTLGGSWIESTANERTGTGVPNSTYAGWRSSAINGPTPPTGYFNYAVKDGGNHPPFAYYDVTKDSGTSFAYAGSINRLVNTFRVTGLTSPYPSDIDFYDYADTDGDPAVDADVIFDANGDAVLYKQWKSWDTQSATGLSQVDSGRLGADVDAVPNDDGAPSLSPPTVPPTGHRWAGYKVTNAAAVRKWGFPDLTL